MMFRSLLIAALLWVAPLAQAAVTTQSLYRLGEADPGAAPSVPGNASTQPSVGSISLSRTGTPTYSGLTPSGISSTLSMRFNGSSDRYGGAVIGTAVDNFGIEAWVRSDGRTTGNAAIAYNGNSGSSGFGLYRIGDSWAGLYGGVQIIGSTVPVGTQWTHLALVRAGGVSTLYVNGVARATTPSAPNAPAGGFGIGGNAVLAIDEFFDGQIDEVRYFTFAPGQFQISDLNLSRPDAFAVPVNAPIALVLLAALLGLFGALGLAGRRA